MKDEIREYFEDILKEAQEIKEFTSNKDYDKYSKDRLLKAGVERKFEIIGEAMNRIKNQDDDILEKIREYRSIISFRNILAHGYDIVEDRIVWGIIESNLQMLIEDVEKVLSE